ncbi:hypothetical protein F4212_14065 [Candidatus Poribacteria bacterium]|nr:hypothetical protein [Candidatus Poribacteria bacterium]
MILQALVDQFKQRFQHEKRAQVCLWFDEKEEFVRLLPSFRAHLESMRSPPFRVLEYDVGQRHGQIWLKYQVYRTLDALPEDERQRQRFLIYLPLSEDRLEHGVPSGEPALDMLTDYRIGGVTWRIGGKRPTLFSFLKQANVKLPRGPRDQQSLNHGARSSFIAKYVANIVDRPTFI